MAKQRILLKRRRESLSDMIFMGLVYAVLLFIFIATLYPIIFVLSASVSDPAAVSSGEMLLWPVGFNLNGYIYLKDYKELWTGYANTIFYTLAGTVLNLLVTVPAAYSLSRRDFVGRGLFMGLFIVTMYFNGGLIPTYLNLKSLSLLNTRWVILLMGLVSTYNMIVCRTFFSSSIPWELHEAAYLDGASDAGTFMKIVLPLSKPILAVMALYYGVGHWNSYFNAMIYLRDRAKYPLQLILREILIQAQGLAAMLGEVTEAGAVQELLRQQDVANQLKFAVIIVSTVPMLVFYPFVEKYFAKGIMIGSVKG